MTKFDKLIKPKEITEAMAQMHYLIDAARRLRDLAASTDYGHGQFELLNRAQACDMQYDSLLAQLRDR